MPISKDFFAMLKQTSSAVSLAIPTQEIVALARRVADQLATTRAASSTESPQLRAAIGQVWAMVRPRLPQNQSTSELDALIQQVSKS